MQHNLETYFHFGHVDRTNRPHQMEVWLNSHRLHHHYFRRHRNAPPRHLLHLLVLYHPHFPRHARLQPHRLPDCIEHHPFQGKFSDPRYEHLPATIQMRQIVATNHYSSRLQMEFD